MKTVYGQILNQLAQGYNKLIGNLNINNGSDNLAVVDFLILVIIINVNQFVNNICKGRRHLFPHLGTAVFGGKLFADIPVSYTNLRIY